MNRFFVLFSLLLIPLFANAQRKPSARKLQSTNAQIVKEGIALYRYEKLNWVGQDYFYAKCQNKHLRTGNVIVPYDDKLALIFFNANDNSCIYEVDFLFHPNEQGECLVIYDNIRQLTNSETDFISLFNKTLQAVSMSNLDLPIINDPEFGNTNVEVIPISKKMLRVYLLPGTIKSNCIPFGFDCSLDIDVNQKIRKVTRYHNSLLAMEINPDDKAKAHSTVHSHLEQCPYISPTDICTFLLFGHDLYGQNSFSVYSPSIGYLHIYNADSNSILSLKKDALERIVGK